MADIDIFAVTPHQVSRDMRGYSVLFYGEPKTGKTTTSTKFPRHLLLAAEKGYNAIPGAMAIPINTWSEFRKALRQLKDPKAKETYETIVLDTIDLFYDFCEKYICQNAKRADGGTGVDTIGDIAYGRGYTLVAKEFDECLRSILQMGYGLVMISHSVDKVFKDEAGNEFNQIVPTLGAKARNIVDRMVDVLGYSRVVQDENGNNVTKLFMRGTPRYVAGSRFKFTPDYIDFNYQSLVAAIGDAIDKQMEEEGSENFTNTRSNLYSASPELNFDDLMNTFNNCIETLISNHSTDFETNYQPKIIQITEKYLGKGQKVSNISRDQVEALSLIVDELKDLK